MSLVFKQSPKSVNNLIGHWEHLPEVRPMTIRELIKQLQLIADQSTPVYLESGQPVHYTCHGTSQNETRFFIGVV